MHKGIFITGTGTDVGKTFVTALLVRQLAETGSTAYFKAAMSGNEYGADGNMIPGDALFASPSQSDKSLVFRGCPPNTLCGISSRFQLLSPTPRQVAHALLTRPPLSHLSSLTEISEDRASFDLHVLGTPPAFILSQDQTLYKWY